jgi:hypothetical protein
MKPIGGYFDLSLRSEGNFPPGAVLLNTGRNAFEYILRARNYKKIYMPFYTCEVLKQPIRKLSLDVSYYHLNELLEPEFDFSNISLTEAFLYTNYFSLKDSFISSLSGKCNNLIIDNAQAFYSSPLYGVDTFYSLRKYFGLPDGAWLFTNALLANDFQVDASFDRVSHLLKRLDLGPEYGYDDFVLNEKKLDNLEIRTMSLLTQSMFLGCHDSVYREVRQENFHYLNAALAITNELDPMLLQIDGTFCYPFLVSWGAKLKKKLIDRRIFVPTYWTEVLQNVSKDSIEWRLVNNLVCLPIDQRYSLKEMEIILQIIQDVGK